MAAAPPRLDAERLVDDDEDAQRCAPMPLPLLHASPRAPLRSEERAWWRPAPRAVENITLQVSVST